MQLTAILFLAITTAFLFQTTATAQIECQTKSHTECLSGCCYWCNGATGHCSDTIDEDCSAHVKGTGCGWTPIRITGVVIAGIVFTGVCLVVCCAVCYFGYKCIRHVQHQRLGTPHFVVWSE